MRLHRTSNDSTTSTIGTTQHARNLSKWQVIVAVLLQSISILILFSAGIKVMVWSTFDYDSDIVDAAAAGGARTIDNAASSIRRHEVSRDVVSDVFVLQLFQQLIGAIFISYSLGTGLLFLPSLHGILGRSSTSGTTDAMMRPLPYITVSRYCQFASTISTSIFALCIIICTMVVYTKINDTKHSQDAIISVTNVPDSSSNEDESRYLSRVCHQLLAMGMSVLLLSSTSVMMTFWPTTIPSLSQNRNRISSTSQLHGNHHTPDIDEGNDEEESDPLRAPLLPADDENDNIDDLESNDTHATLHNAIISTLRTTNEMTVVSFNDAGQHTAEQPSQTPATTAPKMSATRRLLQLASSQIMYLYLGCIVLLIRLPFSLAIPHFVSTTLAAVASSNFSSAHAEIQLLFIAGTIDAILDFWAIFLFGYANQRIVRKLRIDLFSRLLRQEVAFFDVHSSGELSSRLNSDCSEMAGDLTWFFRFSIESIVRITGITIYMIVRCPILGGCAISIIPAVATINKFYGDWLRRNAIKVQDALADANMVAQEALSNIRTVISFVTEAHECDRYESRIECQYQLNIQQLFMTALYYMVISTFLINTVVQGTLLWVGSILIERDQLTPGILLAFMLYQSQLQNEVLSLMNSYTSLIKSSGAGDKVFALIDRQPPPPSTVSHATAQHEANLVVESNGFTSNDLNNENEHHMEENCNSSCDDNASPHGDNSNNHILFENVSFSYPTRPGNNILNELNLVIPQGQTVALVGTSGGGKTTVMNLIQRFYDPCSGRLSIYGNDLRTMNVMAHRRQIGIVTQDPILFQGSIRDNITYGCLVPDQVRDEHVVNAARLAHAHNFIETFPDGYSTMIGERGVQLSGGQKQRIGMCVRDNSCWQ
jgi:ABC-type multidrug transport system fused ATPase/permease subunit